MKLKIILLCVIFALLGNKTKADDTLSEASRLHLNCVRIQDEDVFAIYRCFNDEVVCYIMSGIKKGGMSCRFKNMGEF